MGFVHVTNSKLNSAWLELIDGYLQ